MLVFNVVHISPYAIIFIKILLVGYAYHGLYHAMKGPANQRARQLINTSSSRRKDLLRDKQYALQVLVSQDQVHTVQGLMRLLLGTRVGIRLRGMLNFCQVHLLLPQRVLGEQEAKRDLTVYLPGIDSHKKPQILGSGK